MIRSIEIKGLRGIREGNLTDLSPLVILVGPNGSGKSTVIEAILIAAAPNTAEAVVQVIRRHEAGGSGPRWLLWRAGQSEPTIIHLKTDKTARDFALKLKPGKTVYHIMIEFNVSESGKSLTNGFVRGVKNKYTDHGLHGGGNPIKDVPQARLIEGYPTTFQAPLDELYSKAVERGRWEDAIGIVTEVFPGVKDVKILTEHREPILHFVFKDYSVPASLAGDGIQSLLRLSLSLAGCTGGVALLEEPEVHQHPGAIRQTARAILAAVRRNIQVILTTHSLELIDAFVAETTDKDRRKMSLYRLILQEGLLNTSRLPGTDVAIARTTIEDDLR